MKILNRIYLGVIVCLLLFGAVQVAQALTNYAPAALLQPGDITGTMIRDSTITNADVSPSAALDFSKLFGGGSDGSVFYQATNALATTSKFSWYVATSTFWVNGNLQVFGTTTFRGVDYIWPAAQGTSGQVLQTDGNKTLSWTSPASTILTLAGIAGENVTAGQPVQVASTAYSINTLPLITQNGTGYVIGSAGEPAIAQTFLGSDGSGAVNLSFEVAKASSPVDNFTWAIQTDNGSGQPDGINLASGSILGSSMPAACTTKTTVSLGTTLVLTSGTTYWIILGRSGATDPTNQYTSCYNTGNPYTSGTAQTYNGVTWAPASNDLVVGLSTSAIVGEYYGTSASSALFSQSFVGFAQSTVKATQAFTVTTGGTMTGLSGLSTGIQYYLANATSTLSSSAGTVSHKACIAITTTSCLITNIW